MQALVGYFGETREEPCGHCTFCLTGRAQELPEASSKPPLDEVVDREALQALRSEHPQALATPRQVARFLCGLTSPASTRAKLMRHPLYGALADRRFLDVLADAASR